MPDRLEGIYRQFGYCWEFQRSYPFPGVDGMETMGRIVNNFRNKAEQVGEIWIVKKTDYLQGIGGLPKSDVLKLELEDGSSIVVRPSGTEPKLKVYFNLYGEGEEGLRRKEKEITEKLGQMIISSGDLGLR